MNPTGCKKPNPSVGCAGGSFVPQREMADAMMLANRPADTTITAGMVDGPSPSMSIGNYKGVMLCNRPFAGVQAVAATGGAAKAAFVCGQVPREVGLTKYKKDTVAVRRTKKETALTRHRKWLSDLQKTKNELERGYVLELQAKEETKKRFMEREARMRAIVKSSRRDALRSSIASIEIEEEKVPKREEAKSSLDGEAKPETTSEIVTADELSIPLSSSKKLIASDEGKKPLWAMTEEKATEIAREKQDEEVEELLSFAQGLDFEKYIDDMEIATMMDQVKKLLSIYLCSALKR
jgi:hypothetical protein